MSANAFAMHTAGRLPNVFSANGHQEGRQRATAAAKRFSRRNVFQAQANNINGALERFTRLVYESAEDNQLVNVDSTGKLYLAVPWSRKHYSAYGLTRTEADALRFEMMARCRQADHTPLYVYIEELRRWYLDIETHPMFSHAMRYLAAYPATWKVMANVAK